MAKDKKTALAAPSAANALAKADFGEHAGVGFENQTTDDIAIPFLGLVQALSPEKEENHPKQIPGAVEGSLFNTVTRELFGDTVYFVPCTTEHVYVEWISRDDGGGFVGIHTPSSEFVKASKAAAEQFNHLKTDEGHELQETFYIYGLLLDGANGKAGTSPIVIAFTSTKIKKYKALMTKLHTVKSTPPMYAFRLGITSCPDKNKKGQPFKNFEIAPAQGASIMDAVNLPGTDFQGLLEEGKALVRAVQGGLAKADHASQTGETKAEGDADEVF